MLLRKFKASRILISTSLIIFLILFFIALNACSKTEKEADVKESIASIQSTESSDLDQADESTEALEIRTQQSILESSGSEISEQCYNPYIPIKPGTVWTYEITVPVLNETSQFTKTQERIDSETFKVIDSYPGYALEVTWKCTENGIIQNEYAGFDMQNMPEGMEFNTIEFKGITYPPVNQWQIGKTWNMDYTISAKGDTDSGELVYDGHVIIDNEIVAEESVEVPAGVYSNSLRVDSTLNLDLFYKIQGVTQDVDIELDLSTWYSRDVGMVKQVSDPQDSSSTAVLLSME